MPGPTNDVAARRLLESMIQADGNPALTDAEVDDLFALAKVPDYLGVAPDALAVWSGATTYALGAVITPITRNGYAYVVTTAGTSSAIEPTWPTDVDSTVTDGTVVWTRSDAAPWTATYNLPMAAAEGWAWKAAKVVAQYDVKAGSVDAKRSQIYQHCLAMEAHFRAMSGGDSAMTSGAGWLDTVTY